MLLLAGIPKAVSMTTGMTAGHPGDEPASSASASASLRSQAGSAPADGEKRTRCTPRTPSSTPQGRPGGRTWSSRLGCARRSLAARALSRAGASAPMQQASTPSRRLAAVPVSWCWAAIACASAWVRAASASFGVPVTSSWVAKLRSSASRCPTATASGQAARRSPRRVWRIRRSWRCTRRATTSSFPCSFIPIIPEARTPRGSPDLGACSRHSRT